MKAWAVSVLTNCQHGQILGAYFYVCPSRAEAIGQAVHHAMTQHDPTCPTVGVSGTTAHEVSKAAIDSAVAQLTETRGSA